MLHLPRVGPFTPFIPVKLPNSLVREDLSITIEIRGLRPGEMHQPAKVTGCITQKELATRAVRSAIMAVKATGFLV